MRKNQTILKTTYYEP